MRDIEGCGPQPQTGCGHELADATMGQFDQGVQLGRMEARIALIKGEAIPRFHTVL